MMNDDDMTQSKNNQNSAEYLDMAFDAIRNMRVDLKAFKDCDLDVIDALEHITLREAMQILVGDDRVALTSEGDLRSYIHGIARPVAVIYNSMRRNKAEASLYTLLFHTARLAYEVGVRDASEGRLSKECMFHVAKARDTADYMHEELIKFNKELGSL